MEKLLSLIQLYPYYELKPKFYFYGRFHLEKEDLEVKPKRLMMKLALPNKIITIIMVDDLFNGGSNDANISWKA